MSLAKKRENLIRTKKALAEKYERLARAAHSRPKRTQFEHKAERYRRLVEQLGQS